MRRKSNSASKLVLATAWSCLLMGCIDRGENADGLNGRLIFSDGTRIGELNLKSGNLRVVEENPASLKIADMGTIVSLVDENTIVLHSARPFGGGASLREVKLDTASSRVLRAGAGPTYLPARRKIVFFQFERRPTPGYRLYVADYDNPEASAVKVSYDSYDMPRPVIPVSENEIVIARSSGTSEIGPFLFNVDSSSIKELPLSGCRPALWRSATQQLLCFRLGVQNAYLSNLSGTEIVSVDIGKGIRKGFVPVNYIAKHDVMIAAVPRISLRGEPYDLYSFSFNTQKWDKLLNDCIVGLGAATWVE